MTVSETCRLAKEHAGAIAFSTEAEKNQMLALAADALVAHADEIIEANKRDVAACTRGEQFRDRLMLDETRIRNIAEGLRQLIRLACPVGEVIERYTTPNGLDISRVRVPFGVVGVIYEARPNVTADAAGLCIKSGNAVVLRGSKDALASNQAIVRVMKSAIAAGGSDPEFIQLIADASHEGARAFMRQKEYLDVLIPRGSAALIQAALENATVPVIETGTGNCHVYVERTADLAMASGILCNAKTQRISVCNACESLVVDDAFAREHLDVLLLPLLERGVEIVGDERARAYMPAVGAATDEDYFKEYLAMKISVKVVSGVEEAIAGSMRIPPATAKRSSRRINGRRSGFCARSIPPASMSTHPRALRTALNSGSARKWGSRRKSSMHAVPWGSANSRRTNSSSAGTDRSGNRRLRACRSGKPAAIKTRSRAKARLCSVFLFCGGSAVTFSFRVRSARRAENILLSNP